MTPTPNPDRRIGEDEDLCACGQPMRDWRGRGMECMSCMVAAKMREPDPLLTAKIPWWANGGEKPKGNKR